MTTADATLNNPVVNDPGEVWVDGDLPQFGGGGGSSLLPGVDEFLIPANIAQLWDTIDAKDNNPKSKTYGQIVRRNRVKFDKNAPLIVVSGPRKGETFTANYSGVQRQRGRDAETAAFVSDLALLLEIGLGDKTRPTTAEALKARINQYAGKTIRIEHGLSAHCRSDKVRYILSGESSVPDPTGQKGCGDDTKKRADGRGKQGRYYTKDFKDPATGDYLDTIECDCGAILRGFPSHERFLPPLGSK